MPQRKPYTLPLYVPDLGPNIENLKVTLKDSTALASLTLETTFGYVARVSSLCQDIPEGFRPRKLVATLADGEKISFVVSAVADLVQRIDTLQIGAPGGLGAKCVDYIGESTGEIKPEFETA